jgi:TATA-binding protein-associated factor Taf7
MKRDKLRIGVITAALAMMIAGGVLTWQQDARNGKADQAKQGETAQLTEDESTGTTEQQTEETAGDADGTRAVQDQADDVENSLEQVPEMEAAFNKIHHRFPTEFDSYVCLRSQAGDETYIFEF